MNSITAFIQNMKTPTKIIIAISIIILGISLLFVLENKDKIIRYFGIEKTKSEEKLVNQSNVRNESLNQLIVTNNYINIRSSGSINSEILGKVYKDEVYTILDILNDDIYYWYQIETSNNMKGFIASEKNNPYITLLLSDTNDINVIEEIQNNNNNNASENNNSNANNNNNTSENNNSNANNNNNNNNNASENNNPTITYEERLEALAEFTKIAENYGYVVTLARGSGSAGKSLDFGYVYFRLGVSYSIDASTQEHFNWCDYNWNQESTKCVIDHVTVPHNIMTMMFEAEKQVFADANKIYNDFKNAGYTLEHLKSQ